MPRRAEHLSLGKLLACGGVQIAASLPTHYSVEARAAFTGSFAAGALTGSLLPDKIEPAFTPRHRGFFHSVVVLVVVVCAFLAMQRKSKSDAAIEPDRSQVALNGFLLGLSAGYAGHLGLDVFDPSGLPLIT